MMLSKKTMANEIVATIKSFPFRASQQVIDTALWYADDANNYPDPNEGEQALIGIVQVCVALIKNLSEKPQ